MGGRRGEMKKKAEDGGDNIEIDQEKSSGRLHEEKRKRTPPLLPSARDSGFLYPVSIYCACSKYSRG